MLHMSETLIHVELGSVVGGNPNRLGREVWLQLGRVFMSPAPLLQILNLSGTFLGTDDFQKLVECLRQSKYRYLQSLDLSNNRLSGNQAGLVVAQLITREFQIDAGYNLNSLNLSNNKIGNKGVEHIFEALT